MKGLDPFYIKSLILNNKKVYMCSFMDKKALAEVVTFFAAEDQAPKLLNFLVDLQVVFEMSPGLIALSTYLATERLFLCLNKYI
jgi:hypothetical protein